MHISKLCPRCRKSSFNVKIGFTKPTFICVGCDHSWQSGRDGEPYLKNAQNFKEGESYMTYTEYFYDDKRVLRATGKIRDEI